MAIVVVVVSVVAVTVVNVDVIHSSEHTDPLSICATNDRLLKSSNESTPEGITDVEPYSYYIN